MHSPQLHPRPGLPLAQALPPALTQRVDELERVNGHQASFLARLSHELRNGLAPLHHSVELLRLQNQAIGTAQTVTLMQRHLTHLRKLVDELLDTERIAQGKLTLHKQTVILQNLLDDAVALSAPALTERNHSLTLQVPRRSITIEADPTRLTEVMVNLLVNAAKYTPPGGKVTLRVQASAERVCLAVIDNGIGLSSDELPFIFDLYAQVASSRRMDHGGLGVGLALARQLVELHGGTLKAESDGPGQGSRFSVELALRAAVPIPTTQSHRALQSPLTPATQTGADPVHPVPQTLSQTQRILVVDDHIDGADTLALALQCLGYQAHSCYSGPQAIEQAAAFQPQAVLLDLSMPGMDGYELAQQLRQSHPHLALVAMTGWADSADRARCLRAGFDGHLSKPASIETIEALLASLSPKRATAH
jgi:CheY-like chemotaxis protein